MDIYSYIAEKISEFREKYPSLRTKPDYYIFSALCVEANFYKNPENVINESNFEEIIVDSCNDGGADIILNDPDSENFDLVIGQSKFYEKISKNEILDSFQKMVRFHNEMKSGHYEQFNSAVQNRFLSCESEISEESKIHFVLYMSAPSPKKFDSDNVKRQIRQIFSQFQNSDAIKISIFFAADIKQEIETAKSMKQIVERGKIQIDKKNNFLLYGDNAAIVNVSAFSIKQLYATHNISLLAQNLRYHIGGGKIDKAMKDTIEQNPESFWLKNNGITIICDDFQIDGREVHLRNFSIVNGGQTTYNLHKSKFLDRDHDFWLSCKIIKTLGTTEKEKNIFSLEIAKAANSQKPINQADLRANAPEQRSFAQYMRAVGIFYQTKRGEKIPKQFSSAYLHTKLLDVGKLCLAAIFQEPCRSRSKPSDVYLPKYYEKIFNEKIQKQISQICKELLYMDYYFTKKFLPKFRQENKYMPVAVDLIPFANTSRTICISFTALSARYAQGNIKDKDITLLTSNSSDREIYETLCNISDIKFLLPSEIATDSYDKILDQLFKLIIVEGFTFYSHEHRHNEGLTAANFLKKDDNYYTILKEHWIKFSPEIKKIFNVSK